MSRDGADSPTERRRESPQPLRSSMSPRLFEPIRLDDLTLDNRIIIAPMCQYSDVDGCMNDWHVVHLGHLALSGAAILTIEATAVMPE